MPKPCDVLIAKNPMPSQMGEPCFPPVRLLGCPFQAEILLPTTCLPQEQAPRALIRHRVFIGIASWCYISEGMSAIHLPHHSYAEAWEERREALPRLLDIVLSSFLGSRSASWITRQVNCFLSVQSALVTSRRLKMKKP